MFGLRSLRAQNRLTLSFNQTFEAKVESDDTAAADTVALGQPGEPRRLPQAEKITLLALNTSTPLVYDFVAAHHHGIIDRTHIVQALMPLYRGRVAAFLGEHASAPIAETEQHLERLSEEFQRQRQYLIDRWRRTQ